MYFPIGCIFWTYLHCAFSNESSNCLFEKMHSHTGCICLTFLQCLFSKWALKLHIWEDASHTSCNHCIRSSTLCIVTPWLLLFFLFSTVYFQMTPQITCLTRCIVALVAFFYCCFQLSPQFACLRICLVTAIPIAKQSHWQHLFDAFFICVFSNESSNHLLKI